MKKLIAPVIIVVVILLLYFVVPKPLEFSPVTSTIILSLIGLALVAMLILTIAGKMIGRRTVFIFIAVALTLPFMMNFKMPIRITPEVQSLYDALEQLPAGSKVLAAYDFDPPSAPELQPMADAFMTYAFKKDLRVIIMGLWPQGPQQAQLSIEAALEDKEVAAKNLQYGVDYVNLGFQAGNEFVIQRMGSAFRGMFARDSKDTPYDDIPLLKGVENFSNIDFVMNFSAGKPGTQEWVQIAVDRFGVTLGAGNTAVQAPGMYPFLKGGQLVGLLGGMSGGAEFELVTGEPGKAAGFMLSQSCAHVVVIAFILIGNVAMLLARKKK
ncbi:MAG: hypothetical protein KAT58_00760 [candidate division Zixibacteria bacterium]|nr:hypothetical protein [candidate division Zixibacteria bacterium]